MWDSEFLHTPNKDLTYICSISGGKDSVAMCQIARRFPEVFEQVQAAEDSVSEVTAHYSFWTPDFIPERFSSREWTNPKDGKKWKIPTPMDVRDYVKMTQKERRYGSYELFSEPQNEDMEMCSSIYGLCE